jgi:hypothetical protein
MDILTKGIMNTEELINGFIEATKKSHQHTLDGNWRKGNAEIKKINEIVSKLKASGESAMNLLLDLTSSDDLHVALMAAVYCMRFSTKKCLSTLTHLATLDVPHISSSAKYSIINWTNGEWGID